MTEALGIDEYGGSILDRPNIRDSGEACKPDNNRENPDAFKDEWPEPEKIEYHLKPVDSMDESLMPDSFRPWVSDMSHRMQTPPDFSAITSIVIASSLIGTGCTVRPKTNDDWTIVPNLWGACVGRPSVVLKSPSMKEPMKALERLQQNEREKYNSAVAEHNFYQVVCEAEIKEINKKISKLAIKATRTAKDSEDMAVLKQSFIEADEDTQPMQRLFKTNETSVQSQTKLQQQNPRGILMFRDELTALLARMDTKEGEEERNYFLEGWNGDLSYTDYKIGRGLTDADNICISLLGGIQPDKLRRYLKRSASGTRQRNLR